MYKFSKTEWAWAMYDFANSAYALIVLSLFFPLFFAKYIAVGKPTAELWGFSVAASILLCGLISPILGAYADKSAKRKRYFVIFSVLSVIGTILLHKTADVQWLYGILIFIIVNAAFGISRSLYDSFITVVPQHKNVSTVISGFSWSIGYIGGPLCLLIAWFLMGRKFPVDISDYRLLFIITGFFFLIFSMWTYISLPRDRKRKSNQLRINAFQTVLQTLHLWKELKHIFIFLIAMYFIMDGVTTIIYFISLFAKVNLKFSLNQIVELLLIVQAIGIITTFLVSWLAEKYGEIRLLMVCSAIWILIIIMIFVSYEYTTFIGIAFATGIVIGSTPAIARGYFGKIIPEEKRAELFGFNTFASRIAAIVGPLIFGIASSVWNMRIAIITIIPFFLVGIILLIYLNYNLDKYRKSYL
jgi:UMF1 family MFS transporter